MDELQPYTLGHAPDGTRCAYLGGSVDARDFIFEEVLGGSWASKKMVCGARGRQDPPPEWRPTRASKNQFFEAQVGTHFGGVLAAHARLKLVFGSPT